MKTVAFAGQYPLLKQMVNKYIRSKKDLDIIEHQMANGGQVKIFVSRDPFDAQPNRYQWTSSAEHIFVCVDTSNIGFTKDFIEEIKTGRFEMENVVLVGHANVLNEATLQDFREFALAHNLPMIFCSLNTADAYYARGNYVSFQDFHVIIESVINNALEAAEEISEEEAPAPENKRRKCRIM